MLKQAYEQRKNDPYIIDSIGWAYYLIGDYVEAERAWEIARAAISSGLYKTVILDELNLHHLPAYRNLVGLVVFAWFTSLSVAIPRTCRCTTATTHPSATLFFEYIVKYKCWAHARCVIIYCRTIHKLIRNWINIYMRCNLCVSFFSLVCKGQTMCHAGTPSSVYKRSHSLHVIL